MTFLPYIGLVPSGALPSCHAPRCPQATRGWEVATLRRGIAGLDPQAAAHLGLFCRQGVHGGRPDAAPLLHVRPLAHAFSLLGPFAHDATPLSYNFTALPAGCTAIIFKWWMISSFMSANRWAPAPALLRPCHAASPGCRRGPGWFGCLLVTPSPQHVSKFPYFASGCRADVHPGPAARHCGGREHAGLPHAAAGGGRPTRFAIQRLGCGRGGPAGPGSPDAAAGCAAAAQARPLSCIAGSLTAAVDRPCAT